MGQPSDRGFGKLWDGQPNEPPAPGIASDVVELESERTQQLAGGVGAKQARDEEDGRAGTSRLDLAGARARQLSRHPSVSQRTAWARGESGNDHRHRAKRWTTCAKLVGAASASRGAGGRLG